MQPIQSNSLHIILNKEKQNVIQIKGTVHVVLCDCGEIKEIIVHSIKLDMLSLAVFEK